MTKNQVRRLYGEPATTQGRCWKYSVPVNKYLASQHVVKEVLSVCFYAGRFTDKSEQDYVRSHGKLVPYRPG